MGVRKRPPWEECEYECVRVNVCERARVFDSVNACVCCSSRRLR